VERSNSLSAAGRQPRVARGYLGHHRPAWERAYLAAGHYARGLPIERPTLAQVAVAYRVSIASIRLRLNGKPKSPSLAEHLRSASAAERIEAAKALGVDQVWDTMVLPLVGNGAVAAE
jgi:hypothetical protein